MGRKKDAGAGTWVDPDDAPELSDEHFERADVYEGEKLVRRGRPKAENPKKLVSMRLDADVVERLRASGPGWQSRANQALRELVGLSRRS